MNTLTRAVIFSVCLSAVVVARSPITGDWIGTVQDDGGEHRVMMSLTVTDGVLTGSVIEPEGMEFSIYDGSQVDNELQFNTAQQVGETRIVTLWTGTQNGDEIAFTRSSDVGATGSQSFVVRRH